MQSTFDKQLKFLLFLYSLIVSGQRVIAGIGDSGIVNFQCSRTFIDECIKFPIEIFSLGPWNFIAMHITPNQCRRRMARIFDKPICWYGSIVTCVNSRIDYQCVTIIWLLQINEILMWTCKINGNKTYFKL